MVRLNADVVRLAHAGDPGAIATVRPILRRLIVESDGALSVAAERAGWPLTSFRRAVLDIDRQVGAVSSTGKGDRRAETLMQLAARLRVGARKRGPKAADPNVIAQHRQEIVDALDKTGGALAEAAKLLEMPVRTLRRRVAEFGIDLMLFRYGTEDERRKAIVKAVAEGDWTLVGAAKLLGVSRMTVDRQIERLGISRDILKRSRRRRKP